MVDEKQLRILKEEGVYAWNKWQQNNINIEIDFAGANLAGANLAGANLTEANLTEASLYGANLAKANLRKAYLYKTNLTGAYLYRTELYKAYLTEAYLTEANFIKSDLEQTNLQRANCKKINLEDVILYRANLERINLEEAILYKVNFEKANLEKAILYRAKFKEINFTEANLSEANLAKANFLEVNLEKAILIATQALHTNFNTINLTEACIEDWNINNQTNLSNIICDFFYLKGEWNHKRKQYDFLERRPSDPNRNFEPGEFAKLIQKSTETIDLIFKDGIDWRAFLCSYQDIQVEYGNQNVSIQAIENKRDGAFVIRLNAPPEADKGKIESHTKELYESNLKALEDKYRVQLEAKDEQIAIYRQHNTSLENIVSALAGRPIQNIITNTAESTSMSDTFNNDLKGANIANFANQVKDNARQQAKQHNYASPEKQTLAEAAAEIQKLLQQLEQNNPDATPEQQQAYVDAAIPLTLKQRCASALKAAGETAIEEFLDNPYVNVGKAVVKAWLKPE